VTTAEAALTLALLFGTGTLTAITYVAMPALRGAFHHLRTRREA
jgi:hypothetical protein